MRMNIGDQNMRMNIGDQNMKKNIWGSEYEEKYPGVRKWER